MEKKMCSTHEELIRHFLDCAIRGGCKDPGPDMVIDDEDRAAHEIYIAIPRLSDNALKGLMGHVIKVLTRRAFDAARHKLAR
jgi:hypothetical protein